MTAWLTEIEAQSRVKCCTTTWVVFVVKLEIPSFLYIRLGCHDSLLAAGERLHGSTDYLNEAGKV